MSPRAANLLPSEAAQSRPKPPRNAVGVRERGKNLAGRFTPEDTEAPLIEKPEQPTINPWPNAAAVPKKHRGRPRKHASDADRQKAYRERLDQADEAVEKEKLIELILNKTRHGQSKIMKGCAASTWERIRWSSVMQLNNLREELEQMDLKDLRNYVDALRANSDHKGKLNLEMTGSVGNLSLPEAAQISEECRTGKVNPSGSGPCDAGVDTDGLGKASTAGSFANLDLDYASVPNKLTFDNDRSMHRYKEMAIALLLDENGICKIPGCGKTGSQHLYDDFTQAVHLIGYIALLDGVGADEAIVDVERMKLRANDHYQEIREQMRLLVKQDADGTRAARRSARLGRAAAKKRRQDEARRLREQAKKEGWPL